jgi:predicted phage terminase large subunit-like protein
VQRGFRLATSIGGTLTGRGGDIIIVDDPLKPEDAESEAKRTAANEFFRHTLLSRLDDKRFGAIVVVMQRLHMDDMTGFLTSESDQWEVLSLPAIATHDDEVPIGPGKTHPRKAGEPLFPVREPLPELELIKSSLGSVAFAAQYQQEPVPPGGAMIKRAWIKRYRELPPVADHLFVLQSWDTACKGGPDNDWSVCTTWQMTKKREAYLLDVFRRRLDYPGLKAEAQRLASLWRVNRVVVEDAGTGTALVQELRSYISGIIAVTPKMDKQSRMSVVSSKFEAGQVFFPERAEWLPDLESELFAFPGGRFDDQCDSISQALSDDSLNVLIITPELLARAREPGPLQRRRLDPFFSFERRRYG